MDSSVIVVEKVSPAKMLLLKHLLLTIHTAKISGADLKSPRLIIHNTFVIIFNRFDM